MSRTHFFIFVFLTVGLTLLSVSNTDAQTTIQSEKIITPFSGDSSYFLGDWVLPETIRIFVQDSLVDSSHWQFDESIRLWSIKPEFRSRYQSVERIRIEFAAYPFAVRRVFQNREILNLDSSYYGVENDSLSQELIQASTQSTFDDSELNQRGSLSRGIIVGTNQDFALESGLQFELSGKLTDDVSINASLTDKSIPIQPDGATQNIREFDRVFIQLQSQNTTVEMGDVDVSFEQSTFARLNRRLQGAAGYTSTKYGDYNAALSVVRGTFKSLSFAGQDGVQGPYRLSGRDGEEFVIILAGTERIYINGQRIERGQENDYIIDYGLGEVFFTNNLLIKDETRILIEYEYIDQNFNRTLVAAEAGEEFLGGRFRLGASVIRQADGDELLSQQSLTESDIEVLRGIGDNLDAAVVSGERLADGENDNNIRYAKLDTVFNGETYEIFKNIPGSSESIYIVRFSKVEEGTGSYQRIGSSVNGLLYEWVGPNQGDYEPFRRLPAPEQQQMVALNSSFSLSDNIELYGEWAASGYDQNRFSTLDDGDNNDFSYLSGVRIHELNSGIGRISASVQRRYSGERFEYFERTKEVEFDRKWNISRNTQTREAINEASIQVLPSSNTSIAGEYGFINQTDFRGYRQGAQLRSTEKGFLLNYNQDWVRSEDELLNQKGEWFRQKGSIGKEIFEKWTPYIGFEQEKREERSLLSDSLLNTSFSFYEVGPGIRFNSTAIEVDASFLYRAEKRILDNEFRDQSSAMEQRLTFNYRPNNYIGTQNKIAVRSKDFTREFEEQGSANRRGLLIRSVTDYETESDFLNGQFFYEANTQRRALLQEAYIEVGPELGQYVWIDFNEDGVQQIDEFFPELSPNEGIFVRQFLPSDELFPVIDLKARFRNEFKPFKFLREDSDLTRVLSNMELRSRIDIAENSTTEKLQDVYLLRLNTFRNDSSTVQGRLIWEKELDVFPAIPKTDVLIGYNESHSLNQRSTESVKLFSSVFFLNSSYQIAERTRLSTDLTSGFNRSESNRLSSRNFDIRSTTISPGVQTTLNRSWQTSFSVSYASKSDQAPVVPVNARILKIINSHRAFLWRKLQANARMELRSAYVKGSSSSLGTFELTEGTGSGTNLIWSFAGSYRASELIRISFNYDGRTVKERQDIHTLKLVVSAVF
ncbi:MAG: hypothetical protein JJ971_14460 [Balneolaceae bacterium]|nr:hypothetical protein [Balneolaceae bacterium]MBO6547599.1 hypothetical protein [Balneolaceae bacterium]MBO6648110.1 hypothetical protein [Balneolaceae bacterium]